MSNLLVIGASYLQLPLIRKARQLGFRVHAFAWEQGADAKDEADYFYPISIANIMEIAEIADSLEPAGIVSIASDLAVRTVQVLSKRYGLPHNSEDSVDLTSNKARMREAFQRAGLPSPKYFVLSEMPESEQFVFPELAYPLIVKPVDRSGSRGVTRVEERIELYPAISEAFSESFRKEVIVEQFISGIEASVESISWDGDHAILAITDKVTTGPPYFVELEHHQPSKLSESIQHTIRTLVPRALNALEIRFGAAHSEVIIDAQGKVWLTEIGARMGGDFIGSHLVPLSTGYDFVGGVLDIATNNFHSAHSSFNAYSGVKFLNPCRGRVAKIVDRARDFAEVVQHEVFLTPGQHTVPARHSGERGGYCIYSSRTSRFTPRMEDIIHVRYEEE